MKKDDDCDTSSKAAAADVIPPSGDDGGSSEVVVVQTRPYQESDKPSLLSIFEANIREEWGTRYHDGQYLPNAERYIESVVSNTESDLHNIPQVYSSESGGGGFWALEEITTDKKEKRVVGMVGLQVISSSSDDNSKVQKEGEIRRNCILPEWRGKGWGTKLCRHVQEVAKQKNLRRLFCSTPEHGDDVLRFYNRLGFVEFGIRQPLHGTPI